MTRRVFTKLLVMFALLLVFSAVVFDLVLRPIVEHSLREEAGRALAEKAHLVAAGLAALPPQQLPAAVRAQALEAASEVSVFDGSGRLLASSAGSEAAPGAGGSLEPALREGSRREVRAEAGDRLLAAVPAGAYTVRLSLPLVEIRTTLRTLRRDTLIAALVSFLFAGLLAAGLARAVAVRLKRIVVFASRIAAGDLAARMEEGNLDELSEVAAALDSTAARLEQSFAEIERSRRELATLLDSMQEAVVAVTEQGSVSWSNAVMQTIAGTRVQPGRPLVHAIRDPEVLRCVEGALGDREVHQGRATSVSPGRTFEVNAAPMPGGGAVAVLHDVTRIENAEKMRRDFIANVSHELRTPLTSISGYVETLLEEPYIREQRAQEFMAIILKNATRMNRLTEDLLALANVESGDYKLHLEPLPADELVSDAIDALGGLVVDSGIRLESAGAPTTAVLADADAMNQIFGNLIENAMKYGSTGGRVQVGAEDREGLVEFFVRDFGPGIASEHLSRIFERFYRVDKARSRESGGTGLGLAIVRHIVLAHRGQIWAESEIGAGATFYFRLPAAEPVRSAPAEAVGQAEAPASPFPAPVAGAAEPD